MHSLGSCDGPELQEALVVMGEEFPAAVLEEKKKKKTHKNTTQNNPTCEQIFTIITCGFKYLCCMYLGDQPFRKKEERNRIYLFSYS